MRSLYRRQLTMMVSIMLLSFTLLAGAFMLLSYRYIIGETRDSVIRNAGYIASFTSTYYRRYLTLDVQDEFYSSYMASIAMISNSHIIVADSTGTILFATDGSQFVMDNAGQLPEEGALPLSVHAVELQQVGKSFFISGVILHRSMHIDSVDWKCRFIQRLNLRFLLSRLSVLFRNPAQQKLV